MDRVADDRQLLEGLIGRAASRPLQQDLSQLLEASETELASLGLPRPARRRLLACAEVARRYQPKAPSPEPITTPAQALAHLGRLRSSGREALAEVDAWPVEANPERPTRFRWPPAAARGPAATGAMRLGRSGLRAADGRPRHGPSAETPPAGWAAPTPPTKGPSRAGRPTEHFATG